MGVGAVALGLLVQIDLLAHRITLHRAEYEPASQPYVNTWTSM
jgi:hypothetical protein